MCENMARWWALVPALPLYLVTLRTLDDHISQRSKIYSDTLVAVEREELRMEVVTFIGHSMEGDLKVTGYSEADWASDSIGRKSTSGYIFMINNGPIGWSSKKQATVASSLTEAEYIALTHAAKKPHVFIFHERAQNARVTSIFPPPSSKSKRSHGYNNIQRCSVWRLTRCRRDIMSPPFAAASFFILFKFPLFPYHFLRRDVVCIQILVSAVS